MSADTTSAQLDSYMGSHPSPGSAIYSPKFLDDVYDKMVLEHNNTNVWMCPTSTVLLPFFNKHVINHKDLRFCDIGVGTGFYPANANFDPTSRVTLVDINSDCLEKAHSRFRQMHPQVDCQTVCRDVMTDVDAGLEDSLGKFDVVSLMFILHCLPRPTSRKGRMLAGLSALVKDTGILFGATVLGKDVQHNAEGQATIAKYNQMGIFDNTEDGVETFIGPLQEAFEQVEWRIEGTVLLFEARRPRRA